MQRARASVNFAHRLTAQKLLRELKPAAKACALEIQRGIWCRTIHSEHDSPRQARKLSLDCRRCDDSMGTWQMPQVYLRSFILAAQCAVRRTSTYGLTPSVSSTFACRAELTKGSRPLLQLSES